MIASNVATKCPAIAPLATPHGDCDKEFDKEESCLGFSELMLVMFRNGMDQTCAAPRATVASIDRSPHS